MKFFTDIQNIARTRKFWVALGGAVVSAIVQHLSGVEAFVPIFGLLTALGVYEVPNSKY